MGEIDLTLMIPDAIKPLEEMTGEELEAIAPVIEVELRPVDLHPAEDDEYMGIVSEYDDWRPEGVEEIEIGDPHDDPDDQPEDPGATREEG